MERPWESPCDRGQLYLAPAYFFTVNLLDSHDSGMALKFKIFLYSNMLNATPGNSNRTLAYILFLKIINNIDA